MNSPVQDSIGYRLDVAWAAGHTKEAHWFDPNDLVLGFPGRLGRFNIETKLVFCKVKEMVGESLKIYLNVNNSSANTVLNIVESLVELGLDWRCIVFAMSLPPEQDQLCMCSVIDACADCSCGYGLHSTASKRVE